MSTAIVMDLTSVVELRLVEIVMKNICLLKHLIFFKFKIDMLDRNFPKKEGALSNVPTEAARIT